MLVLNISFEHAALNKSNFHKIKSITNGLSLTVCGVQYYYWTKCLMVIKLVRGTSKVTRFTTELNAITFHYEPCSIH